MYRIFYRLLTKIYMKRATTLDHEGESFEFAITCLVEFGKLLSYHNMDPYIDEPCIITNSSDPSNLLLRFLDPDPEGNDPERREEKVLKMAPLSH